MRTCDEVHEDAVKTPRKKKWVKRAHERKRGERKKRKEKMEKGEKRKKGSALPVQMLSPPMTVSLLMVHHLKKYLSILSLLQ